MKKLLSLQDKYRLLAENTMECIWLLNAAEERFEFVSPGIQTLRGITSEEAMQERVEDTMTPESYARVRDLTLRRIPRFMAGDRSPEVVFDVSVFQQRCRDGSLVDVEISTKLVETGNQGQVEVIGVSRDVTARCTDQSSGGGTARPSGTTGFSSRATAR